MWTETPHGGKKKAKPVNKDAEPELIHLRVETLSPNGFRVLGF